MIHSKGSASDSLRISICDRGIDRPLSFDPSNAQLQRDLLMTPMGSYAQESKARSKMVLLGVSFKFPARYPAIHHTFRASGLERLVPANIWCLDILGALCWHNYWIDFF